MIITILSFAFVLGVLVFVHELGHFMAAKRVGIRVLKFQLGFNPTVFGIKRGDTEYSIGAIPLGGYVKMAGESLEEARSGNSDEFLSKSKWERFQVLIMGPTMNLLLAVVVMAVVLYNGAEIPIFQDQPPVVAIVAEGSPAAGAGIVPGDRMLAVNGKQVETWNDFYIAVGTKPFREISVRYLHDGVEVTKSMTTVKAEGEERFDIGDIGVKPNVHPRLLSVNAGDPGDRSGLKAEDIILAVDGKPIAFQDEFRKAIATHAEKPMLVQVKRGDQVLTLNVVPGTKAADTGWLGVLPKDESRTIQPGLVGAVVMSFQENVKAAGLIFETVWGLLTRETSPKQLMGPVAIAQLSGESAQIGIMALLSLMASISLNLGLLNLLPIPVLDGGHILILMMEGLARRDFSERIKERMLFAGLAVLMTLMVTVIYNDLTRIKFIEDLMPWR